MPDFESFKQAFIAGQDSSFREQVALWVSDESISNAEFVSKVGELEWNMAMDRISWINGVDTPQQDS